MIIPSLLTSQRYEFRFDPWSFVVDPAVGGRITSFALGGKEILSGPAVNPDNWGSTFWPSPQSAWGWPPPPQIDHEPYIADLTGSLLTLRSDKYATFGLVMVKKFSVESWSGAVTVEYTMFNEGSRPLKLAPWEITRVPADGVTFYPAGSAPGRPGGQWGKFDGVTVDGSGIAWYEYKPAQSEQKWIADGSEGWLAYAAGDMVLIKLFDDVAAQDQPSDEGEVEIYLSPTATNGRYIEVENQGALRTFAPGESYPWTVKWLLQPLPQKGMVVAGNPALVDFVRTAVAKVRR